MSWRSSGVVEVDIVWVYVRPQGFSVVSSPVPPFGLSLSHNNDSLNNDFAC